MKMSHHILPKLMTAGRLQQTSQPFVVWISDMCLAQYVMYICFTANLLHLHPTLAFQHPSRKQTDRFEAVNAMFVVTEPQCAVRFSSGWFAAWLCISAEQAKEQQGWVQGVQPVVITSITATAGGWDTWMERWMWVWGERLARDGGCCGRGGRRMM